MKTNWKRYTLHSSHYTNGERGFILPMAILLVLVLSISGAGFMQHDYLERVMTLTNVSNHDAFYLANAGIERARSRL